MKDTHIVFFDGVCNLCNKSVDFLIKADRKRVLKYAPLQSAKKTLKSKDSIVFLSEGQEYQKSKAILKILSKLGGFYKFIGAVFSIIPSFILDVFYDLIAKNRYKIFGRKDNCRLPTKEELELFIE